MGVGYGVVPQWAEGARPLTILLPIRLAVVRLGGVGMVEFQVSTSEEAEIDGSGDGFDTGKGGVG
jgi:hypothetical protein